MEQKNKKLKFAIIILIVLLVISASALAGTLIYNYFVPKDPTTVDVPGNIITPEGEDGSDRDKDNTEEVSDPTPLGSSASETTRPSTSTAETTEATSVSATKASAVTLHTRQAEENTPYQATNMFPGDIETKYFRVKVYYKGDIIVRYHADIRPGYEKLSEVLKVKIRLPEAEETLYDGLMRDMPDSLNHALYTTEKTQSELYYEITAYLDTSVGNEYQDKDLIADFRWWVEETDNLDPPPTGDTTNICLWIAIASGSLILLLILRGKRRKETADEY